MEYRWFTMVGFCCTARELTHFFRFPSHFSSVSSVAQSCLTLCDPMNRSTPGLPVHHQLPESTQTHIHRVDDAIQPSHPLSAPSPPAFSLCQHQGLFQWVYSLHEEAKALELSFSLNPSNEHPGLISFRMDCLDLLAVHLGHHKALNRVPCAIHSWCLLVIYFKHSINSVYM